MNKRSANFMFFLLIVTVFVLGIRGIQNLRQKVNNSISRIQEDLDGMQLSSGYLDTLELIQLHLNNLEANIGTFSDPGTSSKQKKNLLNLPDTIKMLNEYCQIHYYDALHQEELFVLTESRLDHWANLLLELNRFETLEKLVNELNVPQSPASSLDSLALAEDPDKVAFFRWVFSQKYQDTLKQRLDKKPNEEVAKAPPDSTQYSRKEVDKQVAKVRKATQVKMGAVVKLFNENKQNAHQMDLYIREIRKDIQSDVLGLQLDDMKETAQTSLSGEFDFFFRTLVVLGTVLFFTLILLGVNHRRLRKQIQRREEFVSKVSHEIKNALHPIIGYASNLSKTVTNPESRKTIWTIKEESQHLLYLANGILDLSKIKGNGFKLEKAPFILTDALNQVVSSHSVEAEKKGVKLRTAYDANLPNAVKGDPERLKQIIRNLLSNGLKHTDKGKVQLIVNLIKERREKALIEFIVADTGRGLSKRNLKKISRFKRYFSMGDSAQQGHGLGLVISHQLVRQHKGTLKIKSKGLGKGVQVIVRIPYEVCATQEIRYLPSQNPVQAPHQLNGKKILVIDDDPLNRELTQSWFEGWGATVLTAANGRIAQKIAQNQKSDLILVDLHMPEVDGVEFVQWLRERRKDSTPVIVCSAGSVGDILEKARSSGANDFLPKPYNQEELSEKIRQFFTNYSPPRILPLVHSPIAPASQKKATAYAIEKLQQEFKGNQDSIDRKIRLLISVCKENLTKIKSGIHAKDSQTINKAVHKMLMLCLYLGKEFVEMQADLEEQTKSVYLSSEAQAQSQKFVQLVEEELKKLENYINYSKLPQ